jgi:hypothetical protein
MDPKDVKEALEGTTDAAERRIIDLLNAQGDSTISVRALLALARASVGQSSEAEYRVVQLERELVEQKALIAQLQQQLELELQRQNMVDGSANFDVLQAEYEMEQQMLDDLGTPTDTPCDTPTARSRSATEDGSDAARGVPPPELMSALQNMQACEVGKKSLSLRSTLSSWFNTPATNAAQHASFEEKLTAFYK